MVTKIIFIVFMSLMALSTIVMLGYSFGYSKGRKESLQNFQDGFEKGKQVGYEEAQKERRV